MFWFDADGQSEFFCFTNLAPKTHFTFCSVLTVASCNGVQTVGGGTFLGNSQFVSVISHGLMELTYLIENPFLTSALQTAFIQQIESLEHFLLSVVCVVQPCGRERKGLKMATGVSLIPCHGLCVLLSVSLLGWMFSFVSPC